MGDWWPKEADPTYHPKTTRQDKIAKLDRKFGGEYTSSGFTTRKGVRQAKKFLKRHQSDDGLI